MTMDTGAREPQGSALLQTAQEMRARAERVLRAGSGHTHDDCRGAAHKLARDVVALTEELERVAGVGEARPAAEADGLTCMVFSEQGNAIDSFPYTTDALEEQARRLRVAEARQQECHICHRRRDEPGEIWCSAGHPVGEARPAEPPGDEREPLVAYRLRAEAWLRDYDDITVEREAGRMILHLLEEVKTAYRVGAEAIERDKAAREAVIAAREETIGRLREQLDAARQALERISLGVAGRRESGLLEGEGGGYGLPNQPRTDWELAQEALDALGDEARPAEPEGENARYYRKWARSQAECGRLRSALEAQLSYLGFAIDILRGAAPSRAEDEGHFANRALTYLDANRERIQAALSAT
jgi:hypothetical protein